MGYGNGSSSIEHVIIQGLAEQRTAMVGLQTRFSEMDDKLDALDARLRSLETKYAWVAGAAAMLGALAGFGLGLLPYVLS